MKLTMTCIGLQIGGPGVVRVTFEVDRTNAAQNGAVQPANFSIVLDAATAKGYGVGERFDLTLTPVAA